MGVLYLLELVFVDFINIFVLGLNLFFGLNIFRLEEMELCERFVWEDDVYNYFVRYEVLGKNMENRDLI